MSGYIVLSLVMRYLYELNYTYRYIYMPYKWVYRFINCNAILIGTIVGNTVLRYTQHLYIGSKYIYYI